ncbi:hypothetical protein [Aeromonas jandaei]|uniref:hypothetical protein n=1 Tax=Aeromonas jandaei TaxID=650 RepID=UPI001C04A9E5|nr:hypothetical protein [Aeromonas jandaei]QWL64921.1 hypothetical protein HQ398_01060 [Aeromonas jandaei]
MHRIDTSTAQKDKFGEGKNGFTAGDPQTGTPATEVSADILDAMQEEIAAVIEDDDSGASLDKSNNKQLVSAIKKIASKNKSPDATELAKGIAKFPTQSEASPATPSAASSSLMLSVLRGLDLLKSSAAQASGTQQGTMRTATQSEVDARSAVVAAITPDKLREVGVGQTWQDLTASRALGTTYTNTTGRPIMAYIGTTSATTSSSFLTVSGVQLPISQGQVGGGVFKEVSLAIVPPGATYSATASALEKWMELR